MEPILGLALWNNHQMKNMQSLRLATVPRPITFKPQRGVVFVEPRKHPSCEYVLRNMRYFLPDWMIYVVHGTSNEVYLKELCSTIFGNSVSSGVEFINCKFLDLPNASYNTLFTSPDFWNLLPEYALIAQTDTLLMKPASDMLETFIQKQYAFVGAPWNYSCNKCKKPITLGCGHMIDQAVVASMAPNMVGNGGLSFRDCKKMAAICSLFCMEAKPTAEVFQQWPAPPNRSVVKGTSNEDVFFCKVLTIQEHAMPSRQEALEFAVEQVAPFAWNSTNQPPALGAHKPWAYLPIPLVESMLNLVTYS
jgi:hypothetical protein